MGLLRRLDDVGTMHLVHHLRNSHNLPLFAVFTILIVAVVMSGLRIIRQDKPIETDVVVVEDTPDYYEGIELEAEGAFVWDMKERRALFAYNADEKKPLASISKLMTAHVAAQRSELDPVVVINDNHLSADGDAGLLISEKWNVGDLIDYTLMVSANDGAKALASVAAFAGGQEGYGEEGFIEEMNERGSSIGWGTLSFSNPSGLDLPDAVSTGGMGSARDVSLLVDEILRTNPDILEATTWPTAAFRSADGVVHSGENTNPLTREIPFILASKTGYTDLAGGNLTVAFDMGPGHPVVITVLGSGVEGRFEDVEELYRATLKQLQHD